MGIWFLTEEENLPKTSSVSKWVKRGFTHVMDGLSIIKLRIKGF